MSELKGYRLYLFGLNNRISKAVEMMCRDDEHAIEVAGEHGHEFAMELWCEARFVRSFPAKEG